MKVGRNEPCHCGSGKKYKKCCQDKDSQMAITKLKVEKDYGLDPFEFADDYREDELQDVDFYGDPEPFPNNPDLSDEENLRIEKWWMDYDPMEDPDSIRRHIEYFMAGHPELLEYLDLNGEVIFELGSAYRQEDRFEDYAAFLMNFSKRFPEVYAEYEGYYNLDMIAWLISSGRHQEIRQYFLPYIADPSVYAGQLFDLVDLLIAKDITAPLLLLVKETKDTVLNSQDILASENILIPFIYDKLNRYLKDGFTSSDLENFVDEFVTQSPNHNKEELISIWTKRFNDTLRPYGSWEFDFRWERRKMIDFYYSVSDNYMKYLHERFNLSWISAQYHSSLIYEYGVACLDFKNGKKPKKTFDFSQPTIDKVALSITAGPFNIPDPVTSFSLINAIYYFVEYLQACDMPDGIDPPAVQEMLKDFHAEMFAALAGYSSQTFCFKEFPFWKTE